MILIDMNQIAVANLMMNLKMNKNLWQQKLDYKDTEKKEVRFITSLLLTQEQKEMESL